MAKIEVASNGVVREIWLARGEKRNALDSEMLDLLTKAFDAGPSGDERVAVIRAQGPVFCAGLDLRERGGGAIGASAIETMLGAIEHYPLPVVAVVQGDAIAGGAELALHCDFVVASEGARIGMSLARIGLAPSWFLAKKLLEVAGPVGARELLLIGQPLSARRMAQMGLIHRAADGPGARRKSGRQRAPFPASHESGAGAGDGIPRRDRSRRRRRPGRRRVGERRCPRGYRRDAGAPPSPLRGPLEWPACAWTNPGEI